jgi:hypothetical protein
MHWIVIGVVALLTVTFWQQIVSWANQTLAGWLAGIFGSELKDAFLLVLAGVDRGVVLVSRAGTLIWENLVAARVFFRRVVGGQAHEKVVEAEITLPTGETVTKQAAESVEWHELPDDVREKFIRRQTAEVKMELKVKE